MHRFQPAHESDLSAIRQLLRDNGLPCDDLGVGHLDHFQIATDKAGDLIACVGLEIHGDDALLRSLVVTAPQRRHGLGGAAVVAAERLAQNLGVRWLYLLTTTAAGFFDARGYRRRERDSAPPALQRTTEFSTLCPASAVCMTKDLPHSERYFVTNPTRNVLFLCTGNSARSILAEALMNHLGKGRFRAFSAGSHPTGKVNPYAIKLLENQGLPVEGLRSKSWDEFGTPDSPSLDFVFTVCDNAAGEVCPFWPGQPITAHWGVEDPAAAEGDDAIKMLAFRQAFRELENRIKIFVGLSLESLDKAEAKNKLDEIGKTRLSDWP